MIPDDRKHHRVGAIQERAILHCLIVHVGDNVRRALTVPAKLVSNFGFEAQRAGHCGAVYDQLDRGKDKSALELTL